MHKKQSTIWLAAGLIITISILALAITQTGNASTSANFSNDESLSSGSLIDGPYVGEIIGPTVFNGDLRDIPSSGEGENFIPPLRYIPGQEPKGSVAQLVDWTDPVAQTEFGSGKMPQPIANFAGLDFQNYGAGWPPDTNGDVGPNHYIQSVNTSIGIYDKATGAPLLRQTFNQFFQGPAGTPCATSNNGDPVVIYDHMADRWIITDFAWFNFNTGPFYECIAVSQTADPVAGGWYYYAVQADTGFFSGYLNDYPKLGVWPDGWYMSANMFQQVAPGTGFGVRVWALDRASMLAGGPANEVHFDLCSDGSCGALLPSNFKGALPPSGAANYFMTTTPPDLLQMWEFHVDWTTPANSTFTGPTDVQVADFVTAQSVPQLGTSNLLDSLSFRPMMQLQYRNLNGTESLWLNHTVAATDGVGGVRWYEIQDPGGAVSLIQQGTFQPDEHHRWMGSLAVDQDGNMAVGYSVSSATMFPAIRYAGRQAGEAPGLLPQTETSLIEGTGAQTSSSRWGDYSTMTVDPVDDCTFWYTTEYYISSGGNWQTRIGSFKFPSCGQPKGYLDGYVYNSVTLNPIADALVVAASSTQTITVNTDSSGYYTMTLLGGTYDMTAGPQLPGYPISSTVPNVVATVGGTTSTDFYLDPVPYLVEGNVEIDDDVALGNDNGFPEPGEQGILLWEGIENVGAITATNVVATLSSSTPGVSINTANAPYPNIIASATMTNTTAFVFSLADDIQCGADLDFHKVVSSDEGVFDLEFTMNASVVLPRTDIFFNDVEGGAAGWTTGGTQNQWAISTEEAHSPTHAWSDSPGGTYNNNANTWLQSPAYDLTGKRNIQISGWYMYALETGYDYVYLEYSLDGGSTWQTNDPLHIFNAYQPTWTQIVVDAAVLDFEPDVALRYRLVSDSGVIDDGIYIDDISMSYEPFSCEYVAASPLYLPILFKE